MKYLGLLFTLLFYTQCNKSKSLKNIPPPTETIVKLDAEDVPKKAAREAWIESMHTGGHEDLNWRNIEYQNNKQTAHYKAELRKNNINSSRDGEIVANGRLSGTWIEKGSDNQSGSILVTKYDPNTDIIYCISAGGTLWKGGLDGFTWEVINQDYNFSNHYLDFIYMEDGTFRLVAAINGRPHFSDDDGVSWQLSDFPNTSGGWRLYDYRKLSDGSMYVLFRPNWNTNMRLYYSKDNGESWSIGRSFSDRDDRNYSMVVPHHSDELYIIEQRTGDESRLYKWDNETITLNISEAFVDLGFGNDKRANLKGILLNDTLRFYSVNSANELRLSKDGGVTWDSITTMPKNMWNVGFEIMPSDPTKMLMGEVEAWKTSTSGSQWREVNKWYDYYDDVFTKLHADIMDIEEYTTADGTPFVLTSNHGGISKSFDGGETHTNIGLYGLNVSQYYSVRTHPTDRIIVYAGAQDQGFQRSRFSNDETESFDQVISGDYGHIVFSGPDDKLWTIYPGGSISYYDEPKFGNVTKWYELEFPTNSVWITPLLANPDKTINGIYVAGGNLEGNFGSYMIRLDYVDGQFIESQFDFDFSVNDGGAISAMAFNHFDHNKIYVATEYGNVFISQDGGNTFNQVQNATVQGHYLYGSCLLPSQLDPEVVYLSGSGYTGSSVLKSTDGGLSYQPMSEGLPPTLVFSIVANEDESLMFAATEAGPYVYITEDELWYPLSGVSAPTTRYWSVEYLPETKTARFGTYGRGIWDFEVDEILLDDNLEHTTLDLELFPNPTTSRISIKSNDIKPFEASIVNMQGQELIKTVIKDDKQIDVSSLPAGTYYLYGSVDGSPITKTFIKQ